MVKDTKTQQLIASASSFGVSISVLLTFTLACDNRPTGRRLSAGDSSSVISFVNVDEQIAWLRPAIGGYPPTFSDERTSERVFTTLQQAVTMLQSAARNRPPDAEIEWRLGDLFRMANNLDVDGSWRASEAHLKKAIAIEPGSVMAHLTLGGLYIDTGPKFKKDPEREAEHEFLEAMRLSTTPIPLAYRGLLFVYGRQNQLPKAIEAADNYLRYHPEDEDIRALRDAMEKNPESIRWTFQ